MLHFASRAVFCIALLGMSAALFAADNIPEVKNGKNPEGAAYTLEIVEDLRMGPDLGDEYLWPGLTTTVTVDDRGHMYVANTGDRCIMEYDKTGAFVRKIGGPGEGPGEFQNLILFQILADGRGAAFEAAGQATRHVWFDKDMKFVERTMPAPPGTMFQQAYWSPDGQRLFVLGIKPDMQTRKIISKWMVYVPASKTEHVLVEYQTDFPNPQTLGTPDGFAALMGENIKPVAQGKLGLVAFAADGRTYTAVAKHYVITAWDSEMNKLFTFGRDYTPISQTKEDIDAVVEPVVDNFRGAMPEQLKHLFTENTIRKALEIADFPPSRLPIQGLNTTGDGKIIAIHNADILANTYTGDLFNKEGKYLGQFKHKMKGLTSAQNMVFKGDYMYRVEIGENDETEIVRYRCKVKPADKI
ncbi:MAG: 6-bladed beta-propeller [Acidobacteriota bacterium]|nr:6-bladed beta-propeller [Acidobacteriota bacterium]